MHTRRGSKCSMPAVSAAIPSSSIGLSRPDALADEAADMPGVRETRALISQALSAGETQAQLAVKRVALLAAAAALRASAPAAVAELFARTRLAAQHGVTLGTSDISASEGTNLLARAPPM
jgi:putative acyl-CoA dehydrogenase